MMAFSTSDWADAGTGVARARTPTAKQTANRLAGWLFIQPSEKRKMEMLLKRVHCGRCGGEIRVGFRAGPAAISGIAGQYRRRRRKTQEVLNFFSNFPNHDETGEIRRS